jgi:hypothetical protein
MIFILDRLIFYLKTDPNRTANTPMNMMSFCMKLMMNNVVVVRLMMNSCSNVVVVYLTCVVDELMHWVSWFGELWGDLLLLKVVRVLVNWWILMCWCYNLKTCVCLSVWKHIWSINIFWIKFWGFEWSKLGFLGKKGLEPVNVHQKQGPVRLSEAPS